MIAARVRCTAACRAVPCRAVLQGCGYYRDDKNTKVPLIAWNENVKVRRYPAFRFSIFSPLARLVFWRMIAGGGG